MKSIKHPHIYRQIKYRPDWYQCAHPDCSHYTRKELLEGKRATCKCGREYILTKDILRLKKPHCDYCTRSRGKVKPIIREEVLKDLLHIQSEKENEFRLEDYSPKPKEKSDFETFFFPDTESELEDNT